MAMKVFLVLFSLFFLSTAVNDCCLINLEKELTNLSQVEHVKYDHQSNMSHCDECECASFCTYDLLLQFPYSHPPIPLAKRASLIIYTPKILISTWLPSIFHPPIA